MVLKEDQERVRMLIQDTISLLCKNGLTYKNQFEIKALIGITLDQDDVFLIDINEKVQTEKPPEPEAQTKTNEQSKSKQQKEKPSTSEQSENSTKSFSVRKAERKRQREVETIDLDDSTDDSSLTEPHSNANQSINPAHRGSTHNPPPAKSSKTDDREIVQIKAEPDSYEEAAGYSGWNESARPDDLSLSDSLISPKGEHKDYYDGTEDRKPVLNNLQPVPVSLYQQGVTGPQQIDTSSEYPQASANLEPSDTALDYSQAEENADVKPVVQAVGENKALRPRYDSTKYKCNVCGKFFQNSATLRGHQKLHLGIYPYTCPYCKKGFSGSALFRSHVTTHTKKADFPCRICGKQLRYNSSRKRHMLSAHPGVPVPDEQGSESQDSDEAVNNTVA